MIDQNGFSIPTDIAPRRDLCEPAFRRYEKYIARACLGSYVEFPPQGIKVDTFIVRMKDAMLGYRRYKYHSEYIPKGFDLTTLKVRKLMDGRFYVENPMRVSIEAKHSQDEKWAYIDASDKNKLVDFASSFNRNKANGGLGEGLLHTIKYKTEIERDETIGILQALFGDVPDSCIDKEGPGTIVVMAAS